jgi:hypothetical protein
MSDLAKKLARSKKASQGDAVGIVSLIFVLVFMIGILIMPPFEDGRAYCFAAVCRSVHQQFLFIFFTLVAHIEMKFGILFYRKNI